MLSCHDNKRCIDWASHPETWESWATIRCFWLIFQSCLIQWLCIYKLLQHRPPLHNTDQAQCLWWFLHTSCSCQHALPGTTSCDCSTWPATISVCCQTRRFVVIAQCKIKSSGLLPGFTPCDNFPTKYASQMFAARHKVSSAWYRTKPSACMACSWSLRGQSWWHSAISASAWCNTAHVAAAVIWVKLSAHFKQHSHSVQSMAACPDSWAVSIQGLQVDVDILNEDDKRVFWWHVVVPPWR